MELAILLTGFICAFIFVLFVKGQQFAHARTQAELHRKRTTKQEIIVVYVDSETGEVVGTGKESNV